MGSQPYKSSSPSRKGSSCPVPEIGSDEPNSLILRLFPPGASPATSSNLLVFLSVRRIGVGEKGLHYCEEPGEDLFVSGVNQVVTEAQQLELLRSVAFPLNVGPSATSD